MGMKRGDVLWQSHVKLMVKRSSRKGQKWRFATAMEKIPNDSWEGYHDFFLSYLSVSFV
jgi:hypothetical protein